MENETPEERFMRETSQYLSLPQGDSYVTTLAEGEHAFLDGDGKRVATREQSKSENLIYLVTAYDPKGGVVVNSKALRAPRGFIKAVNEYRHAHGTSVGAWIRVTRQGTGQESQYICLLMSGIEELPQALQLKARS